MFIFVQAATTTGLNNYSNFCK